jgi:DNA polymerase-3 subunit delta
MFYLLHGKDEYRRSLELERMKAKLGDPTTVDLNTTVLDGRSVTVGEIAFACDAVPFLSDRRLVIVNDLAARLERPPRGRDGDSEGHSDLVQRLEEYLQHLPESARLVFVEKHQIKKVNPIRRLVSSSDGGYEKEFTPLRPGGLARWINERVRERGGRIDGAAVRVLATYVGSDLRLLDHEIDKLLTYVGDERSVTEEDAELLVSYVQEADIFQMVDALGTRDIRQAMELVEKLLSEGQHPLYLLRMITRQFRILLQIKELQSRGTPPADVKTLLRLHPYVAKKTMAQSRNFSIRQLEVIYHRLLETDAAIKGGEIEDHLALNVFVAELAR